jgi:large subunit ribosomal protein L3
MGSERITQKGVTVVDVIASQNLLLVRGGVPGAKGGLVEVRTDA